MNIRSTFHLLIPLMIVLIFSMPFITFAQQAAPATEQVEAVAAGEKDAEADVNKPLWFAAGCCLTVLGVAGAYVIEPSPPANRLWGNPRNMSPIILMLTRQNPKAFRDVLP